MLVTWTHLVDLYIKFELQNVIYAHAYVFWNTDVNQNNEMLRYLVLFAFKDMDAIGADLGNWNISKTQTELRLVRGFCKVYTCLN